MNLTPKQQEVWNLHQDGVSTREIARRLNISRNAARTRLEGCRKKAMHDGADPGYFVTGKSTYYDSDGELKAQWIKTAKEKESLEQMQEAFRAAIEGIAPLNKIIAPNTRMGDSMTIYPMGDPHIGLYAWRKSTGEAFDCDIAEKDLLAAMDDLVDRAHPTATAAIINLGDFFHADSIANQTTAGTPQDVDTRWPRVLEIGLKIMIRLIQRALEKHKRVKVINAIGNHDTHSSIFLSIALRLAFEKNKRVEVLDTVNSFHYFEFGNNLFGVHHGDKVKKTDLPGLMASDQPEVWGRTTHRFWFTGHIHHETSTEIMGTIIRSYRTLSSNSEWSHNQGYRAGRDMYAITFHKEHGETDRYRCDILRARS